MLSLIWSVFCLTLMESRIAWRTPLTTTSESELSLTAELCGWAGACCANAGTPIEPRIAIALVRYTGNRIRLSRLFAFTDTPTCLSETLVF